MSIAEGTTREQSFNPLGGDAKCFAIPAGMPRQQVASVTACCLDIAKGIVREAIDNGNSEQTSWAAVVLLNIAAAGLDALEVTS